MNILFIKCLYLSNLGPFKGLNLDVFRGGLGGDLFPGKHKYQSQKPNPSSSPLLNSPPNPDLRIHSFKLFLYILFTAFRPSLKSRLYICGFEFCP